MTRIHSTAVASTPCQEPAHPLSAAKLHFETGQPRDFVLHLHQHQNLELNYVLKGKLTYFHCGRFHTIKQGQLGVLWASHPHVLTEVDPVTDMLWFHIPLNAFLSWKLPADFLERILEGHILTDQTACPAVDDGKLQQWLDDCQSDDDKSDGSLHEIFYQEVEARLARMARHAVATAKDSNTTDIVFADTTRPHPKAVLMATYVAEHFREQLPLSEVAGSVELHPAYASNIFRQSFNITLGEFVTRCRVAYAIGLLGNSTRTVVDIAFASGFGSVSRFYEAFNKQTGQRPADVR